MLSVYAILFISCSLAYADNAFKVNNCPNADDQSLEIISAKPKSYPFVVPGTFETDIKFKITRAPVPGKQYTLKIKVEKELPILGYIHVPCINGIGSCDFDFCDFLERKSKELSPDGKTCPKGKLPCSCDELKVGTYDIPAVTTTITKDELPAIGVYGDYKADAQIVRKDTQEAVACVHLEFTLADKDECTGLFCFG